MELDILKNFVRHSVEVLVDGVWIEGLMMPIVKSVVVLMPNEEDQVFYGPASLKAESIQAIRQVKKIIAEPKNLAAKDVINSVASAFESVSPKQRFSKE